MAILNMKVSDDLRKRTKEVAKRLCKTTADVARDALQKEVEFLEEKFRREQLIKAQQRGQKRTNIPAVGTALRPVAPSVTPITTATTGTELFYDELAQTIIDAGNDRDAVLARAKRAVEAVQRAHPLTCPNEDVILATLEDHMRRLRERGAVAHQTIDRFADSAVRVAKTIAPTPPPENPFRKFDEFVGRTLDVDKFKDTPSEGETTDE